LHYLDEGAGDQVFLMVHGNPTWSFYWRNLLAVWRDRFRVVVPDHVGCGLSDKPQRYPYSLQRHTANLVELIETLDLRRITLFAHDWGGAIGLNAARACPERFERFVLFNTGAFPPPRVPRRIAICRTPLLGTIALRGFNLFARAAQGMATCRPQGLDADVRAGLIAPYGSWSNRVAIEAFVRDIPLTRRHRTHAELEELESFLTELRDKPTQLIWGMRDWCFDKVCLERLRLLLPEASVYRIDDAGHWVVEDAPDQIIHVVNEFLTATHADAGQPESAAGRSMTARGT
jgi:haloalkane dehalogenase